MDENFKNLNPNEETNALNNNEEVDETKEQDIESMSNDASESISVGNESAEKINTSNESESINTDKVDKSQSNIRIWADPPKKKKSFAKIVSVAVICSIIAGSSIGIGYRFTDEYLNSKNSSNSFSYSNTTNGSIANMSTSKTSSSIIDIAKTVGPSVVSITTKYTAEDFFMREVVQEGQGSGIIFNKDNERILIVTNQHVIKNSKELTVNLSSGESLPASIVGFDTETDLAVVQIKKSDVDAALYNSISVATFGDSSTLQVGEPAIAIGTPISYENTVTVGVISGLNRKLELSGRTLTLIQTDAAINPGNSGGALVNISGEVIGINSVKIADAQVEGIGFAIPINTAKPIINELVASGTVSRPYIGIVGQNVNEDLAAKYGLPVGIFIANVYENSPADIAGLKAEDVIIEFGNMKFPKMEDLKEYLKDSKVGDKVKIKYIRGNENSKEVEIVLKSSK